MGSIRKNFVESIALLHPTVQQILFRLIKDSILYMASGQIHIDDRNRASSEMCKAIAPMLRDFHLPLERDVVLRYLLAIRKNDAEQIAYFEKFGDSVHAIILSVSTYERGLLFGYTAVTFDTGRYE